MRYLLSRVDILVESSRLHGRFAIQSYRICIRDLIFDKLIEVISTRIEEVRSREETSTAEQ